MSIGVGEQVPGTLVDSAAIHAAMQSLGQSARRSTAVREMQEQLQRLAREAPRGAAVREAPHGAAVHDQPVWLSGELGSGRHSAALVLHQLSSHRAGPCLLCHRLELLPINALLTSPDPAAQEEGGQRLQALLAASRGGTLILDEGSAPDPAFQELCLEILRLRPATRLVLLTGARRNSAADPAPLLPALAAVLGGRTLRVPPLRQRQEEIADLAEALWREAPRQPPGAPLAPLVMSSSAPVEAKTAAPLASAAPTSDKEDAEVAPEPAAAPEAALASPTDEAGEQEAEGEPAALSEEAAALLRDHLWPGNLLQLRHVLRWVARRSQGPTLRSQELQTLMPLLFASRSVEGEPAQLKELAQALEDLLRPLVPVLGEGQSPEEELPWTPLLLCPQDPAIPTLGASAQGGEAERLVLRRGPAPMDDGRLVAGLQARPRGPAPGTRTGDAPALARLGQTWRGNLLGLLRAAHRELAGPRAPALSLLSLAQLLTMAGPPVSAERLLRLALHLPVELPEDESAALLRRMHPTGRELGRLSCTSPPLSRVWADAARGLLPQATQARFFEHAERCERCSLLLSGYFGLAVREPWPGAEALWPRPRDAAAPRPPGAPVSGVALTISATDQRRMADDATLLDVSRTAAAAAASGQSDLDQRATVADEGEPRGVEPEGGARTSQQRERLASRRPRRPLSGADAVPRPIPEPRWPDNALPAGEEPAASDDAAPLAPSAASPALAPPPLGALLTPGRSMMLVLALLITLLSGVMLGFWLARH